MPNSPDEARRVDDNEREIIKYHLVCILCVHLHDGPGTDLKKPSCKAFDHIPDEIWKGGNDHHQPYPGDHDIQFSKGRYSDVLF